MPIATEIDHAAKRVRFTLNGELTTPEIMRAVDDALAGVEGRGGYDVLSDNRGITVPATPDQIRELVNKLRGAGSFQSMRAAIVVSSDASYGMIRMLSSMVEPVNIDVRGFRDMDSALAFLDAPAAGAAGAAPA